MRGKGVRVENSRNKEMYCWFIPKEPFISFNSEAQGINVDGNKSTSVEQGFIQFRIFFLLLFLGGEGSDHLYTETMVEG